MIRVGAYEFQPSGPAIRRIGGLFRRLGPTAGALAQVLMENAGRPVSKDEIAHRVWPAKAPADPARSIRVAVYHLRDLLRVIGGDPFDISMVWGAGYMFQHNADASGFVYLGPDARRALDVVLAHAAGTAPDAVKTVREAINAPA